MRRVLDDRDATRLEKRHQAFDLDRQTGDVNRDDGTGPRRHRGEDCLRRCVERGGIDVDENRPSAAVGNNLTRGGKGPGREHDLVARPNPHGLQSEVERRGCGVESDSVAGTHLRGEPLLEELRPRSRRKPP